MTASAQPLNTYWADAPDPLPASGDHPRPEQLGKVHSDRCFQCLVPQDRGLRQVFA